MAAYYNEIDPYCAKWLRNLIAAGHIAPGVVDERDIRDVRPADLRGFAQCHFFAGIGVWSYALRRSGWSDDRPVWTGSCPCQPFSAAGEGLGFADERHLWPAFYHLISEHKKWCESQKRSTPTIFGEQVASKDADPWIDLVQNDLEALGYAVGAVPFPSAGVGAPHIRDRLYWVADSDGQRRHNGGRMHRGRIEKSGGDEKALRGELRNKAERGGIAGRLADANGARSTARLPAAGHWQEGDAGVADDCRNQFSGGPGTSAFAPSCPTNGYWRDADWLFCRDGKWRPVEPGTFPLAHGAPARVGRLRAYGNAINAHQAAEFILAYEGSRLTLLEKSDERS